MDAAFRLTDRAASRIAEIARAQGGDRALRVAVLAGGCSGFQYKFELDANPAAADDLIIEEGGARVLVDSASLDLLAGAELDYTDALMGSHFAVKNPNAASSCGCGTSFAPRLTARVRLATWNVNSIRQRGGHVARWLEHAQPDVLVLQETKCETHAFPHELFAPLGYRSEAVGQKAYNGVAVLARLPFEVTCRALAALPQDDAQARFVEIETAGLRIGGLYLPNGNSGGEAGYAYKLAWMEALRVHAAGLLDRDVPLALLGDYNVCPTDEDFAPGSLPATDALVRPETRARYRALLWLGLTDAVRALHPSGRVYTFWDYQAGAWQRDLGLRIDHALLSPTLAERLVAAVPDREERAQPQPSDHVPLVVDLAE